MSTDRTANGARRQQQRKRVTLSDYIRRRNGVPAGTSGSLRNMLRRSFGTGTLAGFWQYWNPVFGYGLARYVHSPLLRFVPSKAAVIVTFAICGALHDAVTMAIRGTPTWLFTPWFTLLGIGVIVGRAVGMDFSNRSFPIRALVNLPYITPCLAVTVALRRALSIP
jgi:D-alanyl-lipoteichoic acid acyltransferase DltB (MBOAT superfamily)